MPHRIELNGDPLGPGAFIAGMTSYGHFTAMQVRDGGSAVFPTTWTG